MARACATWLLSHALDSAAVVKLLRPGCKPGVLYTTDGAGKRAATAWLSLDVSAAPASGVPMGAGFGDSEGRGATGKVCTDSGAARVALCGELPLAVAVVSPVGTHAGIGVDTQATKSVVDARQAPAAVRRQSRWYAGDSLKKGIKRFVIGVILLERGSKRSAMVPAAVRLNASASLDAGDTACQTRNKPSKARYASVLWSCLSLLFFLATICQCLLLTLCCLFFLPTGCLWRP